MSCDQKEMMREKELLRKEQELLLKEQELRAYEARLESKSGSNFLIQLDLAEAEDDVAHKEKEVLRKEQELRAYEDKERLREELLQELRLEEETKRKEKMEHEAIETEKMEMKKLYNDTHHQIKISTERSPGFQQLLKLCTDNDEFYINGSHACGKMLFITNKNVYYITEFNSSQNTYTNTELRKMYTFSSPVNSKYGKLMSRCTMMRYDSNNPSNNIINKRNIEATIKYILGSYQNGPWKQLDGFFGPYLNEETMELVYEPPL